MTVTRAGQIVGPLILKWPKCIVGWASGEISLYVWTFTLDYLEAAVIKDLPQNISPILICTHRIYWLYLWQDFLVKQGMTTQKAEILVSNVVRITNNVTYEVKMALQFMQNQVCNVNVTFATIKL